MRKALRIFAVILLLAAAVYWAAAGANRGWTVTNVPKKIPDPVTGLEGTFFESGFIPGIDFLGAAFLAFGILTGASFLFDKKKLEPGK